MLLILTHENGDFDAVASQLAAHKLYPEGVPLLPRRVNRNVYQFLALYGGSLGFVRMEEWRRKKVDDIVLVDTQSLPNVRGVKPGVNVRVFDHHLVGEMPASWTVHYQPVGATTTMLVEMLQAAGLTLSPEEATLLLLGIHEDTGSLTYDTSTMRDAQATAWLMAQDAQLNIVRRFLEIPLTQEQQALYAQLQAGAEWLTIEGQSILLATAKAPPRFDDEISSVAHRMRDALVPDSLLVLVELTQHVQLVARSSTEQVDVGALAAALGGGGHSRAAAAMIMDTALDGARQRVLDLLPQVIKPMVKVAQLMSHGVKTVTAATPVATAAEQMQRLGHEGYPVIDEQNQIIGLLTRRAVDRAMSHKLGDLAVHQVMQAGQVMVCPDDSVERVQQLMIEEGWGQIPVVTPTQPPELLGIVTRTDLLALLSQPSRPPARQPNMRQLMSRMLEPAVWQMVQAISQVAADQGISLYFVGGLVRDLLLGKPSVDIDMVVEGDAIVLVSVLQARYGGDLRTHTRFGTAKWLTSAQVWQAIAPEQPPQGVPDSIDFVTARTEFYARPTALPEVARSSIKLDLHRRDFTINTLAVRLDGAHLGQLLDFYGGQRDLEHGVIRVLHSLSFIDDPTRILRAARLEQRLAFVIEERTAELIADALPMLLRITGDRIRHEIELALQEAEPERVLARLGQLGVLHVLHPQLSWQPETVKSFTQAAALFAHPLWQPHLRPQDLVVVYFILWLLPLPAAAQSGVMSRLRVRKTTQQDMEAAYNLLRGLAQLAPACRPSEVVRLVRAHAASARVLVTVEAKLLAEGKVAAAQLIQQYQQAWRHVTPALNGYDLMAMGVARGPELGDLLDHLLAGRLDGFIDDETDERALVQQFLVAQSTPEPESRD